MIYQNVINCIKVSWPARVPLVWNFHSSAISLSQAQNTQMKTLPVTHWHKQKLPLSRTHALRHTPEGYEHPCSECSLAAVSTAGRETVWVLYVCCSTESSLSETLICQQHGDTLWMDNGPISCTVAVVLWTAKKHLLLFFLDFPPSFPVLLLLPLHLLPLSSIPLPTRVPTHACGLKTIKEKQCVLFSY